LFAEKVLGYTTEQFQVVHGGVASDGWALTGKPGKGDILLPYPRPLLFYTRSLDATWEGIVAFTKRDPDASELARIEFNSEETCFLWSIALGEDDVSHPAEALVIACLRAVGVSEEELK
jgi:hypothetical protein